MKNIFLFLIIANVYSINSQALEEKIADKACDCLGKNSEITEDIFRDCLTKSLTDVVFNEKDTKARESINTVDGMQSLLQKSAEAISKKCAGGESQEIKSKVNDHYSDSKIESAQNSYIIAKDFMRDQKYTLAIEGLKLALKQDPNFVIALDDIAVCYRQLSDYDNAIKYYKKSLAIYPEGEYALTNIGVVYSLKSNYKTAIEYYEKLIKYQPNNAEGYFGAGKNYFQINSDEKALDNIFKAHRIYVTEKSEYSKDTETIMGAIYQKMVKENKEQTFKKIAQENNIAIN